MTALVNCIDSGSQTFIDYINQAADIIKKGGVVAFPTETVYGLGASAYNGDAVRKIFIAKNRPVDNPLIIHIDDPDKLGECSTAPPPMTWALANAFWPGPLTIIVNKAPEIAPEATGRLNTAAVRCPDNHIARALINAAGVPIAAPSANSSGRPSPTSAAHVLTDLDGKIDMIIDGGECSGGIESTIIDLTAENPVILRPGLITAKQIENVLGRPVAFSKGHTAGEPKAPGLKYPHYAPLAPLTIVDGSPVETAAYINGAAEASGLPDESIGILATDETAGLYRRGVVISAGSSKDPASVARSLYGVLRRFDVLGVAVIYSEAFHGPGLESSIMNRLEKAAGYHIVTLG